jgi:hypothetical protein
LSKHIVLFAIGLVGTSGCATLDDAASSGDPLDCDDLASESVRISDENDQPLKLLKVRNPTIVTDNRESYSVPTGNEEALILKCEGMGVWSTGDNAMVTLRETVDSDGDAWIKYAIQ